MANLKKSVPLLAFCLYFAKITILPAGYTEALILLILGATASYFEYKSNDKVLKELSLKIDEQQKQLNDKTKDIEALKSSIAGVKLSTGMRPVGGIGK